MDALTFIAELIKAAAWPLATLIIVLVFRGELRALLSRIRKGKVGPAELEFEQEVEVLAEKIPDSLPPSPPASLTTNPRAEILEAWLSVERSAHRLASTGSTLMTPRNPLLIAKQLEHDKLLPQEDIILFNDLRALRNQAAHNFDFSPSIESVIQYVQLASSLKERLDRVARER